MQTIMPYPSTDSETGGGAQQSVLKSPPGESDAGPSLTTTGVATGAQFWKEGGCGGSGVENLHG